MVENTSTGPISTDFTPEVPVEPTNPPLEEVPAPPQPAPEPVPQPDPGADQPEFRDRLDDPGQLDIVSTRPNRPQPEEILLEWTAPNRPFKKRNRQYYFTIAAITVLISLILFFANQFLPIAVVVAVAFLAYVLSAVPPETIRNRISSHGIYNDQQAFSWDELGRFWFTTKFDQRLLHVETARFPNQLTLLLADQKEEDVVELLSQVLVQERPAQTSFEKAATWLQDKIPLDTEG
jgi:hypothetical protein